MALPNEHLGATGDANDLLGYLLAFRRNAPYDGEEFLAFRQTFAEPYIYIDQIAVATGLQRSGIGRALYRELESVALRQEIRLLCCEVNVRPSNAQSLAFHESLGFSPVAALDTLDGRQVRLLKKELRARTGGTGAPPNRRWERP